jgi:hypothetical protein
MKNNVAILTTFQDANLGYSLIGIVIDQCQMLLRHGHKVSLFVNEQFNPAYNRDSGLDRLLLDENFTLEKKTKFMNLTDYTTSTALSPTHLNLQEQAAQVFFEYFQKHNIKIVFTHDFIFTGWNVPYAAAANTASKKLRAAGIHDVRWFHWIHSVPSGDRDWWNLAQYGHGHKIVFPNSTERIRVAESFKTPSANVLTIPHIKDPRSFLDFCQDARQIIDKVPNIMDADVVQVYPCSTDRLEAKQVDIVLMIFAEIKKARYMGYALFANQWATGRQRKEEVQKYIDLGTSLGLVYGDDFAFTSEIDPKFENGVSRKCLVNLLQLSNLLVFPTREESFGLVGPEAALCGALVVANRSLTMMFEVMGNNCPNYDFGSFHQNNPDAKSPELIQGEAMSILQHMATDQSLMTRTMIKRRLNMDYLYRTKYSPMINSLSDQIGPVEATGGTRKSLQ